MYPACRTFSQRVTTLSLILLSLTVTSLVQAEKPAPGLELFENKIRPVLIEHCYECHSAATTDIKGGLRVDSREAIRSGGESGAAVVPHQTGQSLLLDALRHESFEMPPGKKRWN